MERVPIHSVKLNHICNRIFYGDETTARRLGIPTIVAVAERKMSDCHKGSIFQNQQVEYPAMHSQEECPASGERKKKNDVSYKPSSLHKEWQYSATERTGIANDDGNEGTGNF